MRGEQLHVKLRTLIEIMEINGVPVYVHWSILLIGALILFGAIERPKETVAPCAAYFSVLLIHECGHMVAAQRNGYKVYAIELCPFLGFVRFQAPWSRYDEALIAWGGVTAQAAIAFPLVILSVFSASRVLKLSTW
jgi:hypothetical protein